MASDVGLDTYGLVALAVGLCPTVVWWSRKSWRNQAPALDANAIAPGWAAGPRAWRGLVRIQAAMPVTMLYSAVAGAVDTTLIGPDPTPPGWAVPAYLLMLVGLAAMTTIFLFNRPKFLVAPHLRRHPGYVLELLGRAVPTTRPPTGSPPASWASSGSLRGGLAVILMLAAIVWACVFSVVPALLAALVAFCVSTWIIRVRYVDLDWEAWLALGESRQRAAGALPFGIGIGAYALFSGSDLDILPAIALGGFGGMGLAFTGRGIWLAHMRRRRIREAAG